MQKDFLVLAAAYDGDIDQYVVSVVHTRLTWTSTPSFTEFITNVCEGVVEGDDHRYISDIHPSRPGGLEVQ